MKVPFRTAAVSAIAAGLVLPAAASSQDQDGPAWVPRPLPTRSLQASGVFANAFFPSTISIHVGDKV